MLKEFVRLSHHGENFNIRTITIDAHQSSYLTKAHFHEYIEIIMPTSGKIICNIEGASISVEEGQCILINQNVLHYIDIASHTATFTYLQFNVSDFLKNTNTLYIHNRDTLKYYFDKNRKKLSWLFNDILDEFKNQADNYEIYIHSSILKIIVYMSRFNIITLKKLSGNNAEDTVYNVIKYLHKNYNQPLTLDKISEEFNISKYHLSHIFKNITGSTIMEFLTTIRFSHIESLLLKTNKSISQIAYECGFSSIQHFNKVFKKTKGLSPTQYKRYSLEMLKMSAGPQQNEDINKV